MLDKAVNNELFYLENPAVAAAKKEIDAYLTKAWNDHTRASAVIKKALPTAQILKGTYHGKSKTKRRRILSKSRNPKIDEQVAKAVAMVKEQHARNQAQAKSKNKSKTASKSKSKSKTTTAPKRKANAIATTSTTAAGPAAKRKRT